MRAGLTSMGRAGSRGEQLLECFRIVRNFEASDRGRMMTGHQASDDEEWMMTGERDRERFTLQAASRVTDTRLNTRVPAGKPSRSRCELQISSSTFEICSFFVKCFCEFFRGVCDDRMKLGRSDDGRCSAPRKAKESTKNKVQRLKMTSITGRSTFPEPRAG